MSRTNYIAAALAALLFTVTSCTHEISSGGPREIVFGVDSDIEICSRASVVTSLSSFDILAVKDGEPLWHTTATVSDGIAHTGRYWGESIEGATFYASNVTLSEDVPPTIGYDRSEADTDIVVATASDVSSSDAPTLTFSHILSRVGTLSVASGNGYTVSGVTASVQAAAISGTYSLSGTWTDLSTSNQALSLGSNDIWLVPGTYTVALSYTITGSGGSASYSPSRSVGFPGGQVVALAVTDSHTIQAAAATDFGDNEAASVVLANFDTDGDGVMTAEEIASVTSLGAVFRGNKTVTDLDLSMFTSVDALSVAEFNGCSNLTRVVLPEGLEIIYRNAFLNCTSLTDVTLPSTLKKIYYSAFKNCTSLEEITIPAAVDEMQASVFYGCSSLSSVTMMPTTPPDLNKSNGNGGTLSNGYWFTDCASGWHIFVPSESVSAYQGATNWSKYSQRITSQ